MPETNPEPGVTIAMPSFNDAVTLESDTLVNKPSCRDFELFPWPRRWWNMRPSGIASVLKPYRAHDAKRYILGSEVPTKTPI